MRKIKIFGLLIGVLMLTSCHEELDMTVLNKTLYENATITEIEAEDAWNVTVIQDNQRKGVELEYSAFLEEYIKVVNEGSKLSIGFSQRLNLPSNTVQNVTVYVQTLSSIVLKEAATMNLQGVFSSATIRVDLTEASTLRGGYFNGNLDLEMDDASTVVDFIAAGEVLKLELDDASVFKGALYALNRLEMDVENASRATTYSGSALAAEVSVEDASFLNMLQTPVRTMNLVVKSVSEASVNVSDRIEGVVQDVSVVYYQGLPVIALDCDDTSSITPL